MTFINQLFDLFSINYLIHAVSGALANVVAILLFYPLDTVRTRLQVQDNRKCEFAFFIIKDIIAQEGWSSLYEGWKSLVLSVSIGSFVFFYIFHGLKLLIGFENQSVYNDLLFGVVAGSATVLISNPIWVINTRLKLQHVHLKDRFEKKIFYNGITDCFKKVYKKEGISFYFSGLKSSLVLVSNPAINFMIYELCKRSLLPLLSTFFPSSFLYLVFGGYAKLTATIVTYPVQVIQTRAREAVGCIDILFFLVTLHYCSYKKETKLSHQVGLPVMNIKIQNQSFRSKIAYFFRGLESKLIQTVLTSAFMFLVYEYLASLLKII